MLHRNHDPVWLAVVALSVGALFMLIVYWLLRQVLHLSQNATFSTTQSVGSVGDVYLRIPAGRGELGKVMVSVAGSLHELAAQSADGSELPTGCKSARGRCGGRSHGVGAAPGLMQCASPEGTLHK